MKKITLLLLYLFSVQLFSQAPVTYNETFSSLSFEFPVEIQNANDGSNRLFVVEQSGRIKVFQNTESVSAQTTFLDVSNSISFSVGQEIGLLGLAFHPNFSSNRQFYIYHTRTSSVPGIGVEVVVARYRTMANDPNRADAGSRLEILSFDKNQNSSNHNGGKIGFGPDGYLYISVGDGGGSGDPRKNAQNLDNPFGSILRIDVDVDGNNPLETNADLPNGNYEIPSDNPRLGASGMDELYAWGIRNTWKFSFDAPTGRLWGADVGQDNLEEINLIVKGGNFGWNRFEGTSNENTSTQLITNPDIKPVFQYGHSSGDLSITGGYVYRGNSNNALLQGRYIYGDFVSGRVWSLAYDAATGQASSAPLFRANGINVSSFGLDEANELYFSGYGPSAKIYRISGGEEEEVQEPTTIAVNGVGNWIGMVEGGNGSVSDILIDDESVLVVGDFNTIGNLSASNIAQLSANGQWATLGSGTNGPVSAIVKNSEGTLFIGGSFSVVDGVAANNIAMYSNGTWQALESGTNGPVAALAVDSNDNVYVGGAFETSGGLETNNIAVWNKGWAALGSTALGTNGVNNEVRSLAIGSNDQVYLGGNFDTAGTVSAPRIAVWNGSTWGTLGQGTSGFVEALYVADNFIYAGGSFSLASGNLVNRIGRFNLGTNRWESLSNGVSGSVTAIQELDGFIYVAGSFNEAFASDQESYIVNNAARWSPGTGWQALGVNRDVGTNNLINTIARDNQDNSLLIGGNFTLAGNLVSPGIAKWKESIACDGLVQEYRLNGTWSSGEAQLEINEGTETILSILPNTLDFQIRLPNNELVSGDYSLGNITPGQAGTYTFIAENGCEITLNIAVISSDPCIDFDAVTAYRTGEVDWITGESGVILDEGKSFSLRLDDQVAEYTIIRPNGITVSNGLVLESLSTADAGTYTLLTGLGCSTTFVLEVISNGTECPDALANESTLIVFEEGTLASGLDSAVSTSTDVNLSDCAFEVGNSDAFQPWAKFMIPIDLQKNGIQAGDQLTISIDGKSVTGRARMEVVENNRPNTWKIGHTFPLQWQNHTQTITVPANLTTLDIWLHSNYNSFEPGTAVYDNLTVTLIAGGAQEDTCNNGFENESEDILLGETKSVSGLDTAGPNLVETNNSACSLEVSNAGAFEPWSRYSLEIAIDANDLQVGEAVYFSIDGKSGSGQARIEVVENDRPNTWKLGHDFTAEWSTYEQVLQVPENLETWNIWLFSNYKSFVGGNAFYDNLVVRRVANGELVPIQSNLKTYESAMAYPNPTSGALSVSFENGVRSVSAVYIYNLSQVLLQAKDIASTNLGEVDLDLGNYPSGTYIIVLEDILGERESLKVIKR